MFARTIHATPHSAKRRVNKNVSSGRKGKRANGASDPVEVHQTVKPIRGIEADPPEDTEGNLITLEMCSRKRKAISHPSEATRKVP